MTAAAWLIVSSETTDKLRELRDRAAETLVDMTTLAERLKVPAHAEAHRALMQAQTVFLDDGPFRFVVTYSVELGHPVGLCRHMSMSIVRDGRVPNRAAIWMLAEILGFKFGLEQCIVWVEQLRDGGKAINVLQPLEPDAAWISRA